MCSAWTGRYVKDMIAVAVDITRFVSEAFPGFVECALVDAAGKLHSFVEKVPVVTRESLGPDSSYPCKGAIAVQVQTEFRDHSDRLLARIDTSMPWGVESTSGETIFTVLSSALTRS